MEKIDSSQSLTNMIMPRMEHKNLRGKESFNAVLKTSNENTDGRQPAKKFNAPERKIGEKFKRDLKPSNTEKNQVESTIKNEATKNENNISKNQQEKLQGVDEKNQIKVEKKPITEKDQKDLVQELNQISGQIEENPEINIEVQMISQIAPIIEGLLKESNTQIQDILNQPEILSALKELGFETNLGSSDMKQITNQLQSYLDQFIGEETPEIADVSPFGFMQETSIAKEAGSNSKNIQTEENTDQTRQGNAQELVGVKQGNVANEMQNLKLASVNGSLASEENEDVAELEELFKFDNVRPEAQNANGTTTRISNGNVIVNNTKLVGSERSQFELINRVAQEIRLQGSKDKTEIQIRLEPETLGKLTIKLASDSGLMHASFLVENDKAKQMIENNIAELKETLEKQGITIQELSVSVDQRQDELTKHKNIMEARKYSKLKATGEIRNHTDFSEVAINPYLVEDEFSDLV